MSASQAEGRGFDPRRPLLFSKIRKRLIYFTMPNPPNAETRSAQTPEANVQHAQEVRDQLISQMRAPLINQRPNVETTTPGAVGAFLTTAITLETLASDPARAAERQVFTSSEHLRYFTQTWARVVTEGIREQNPAVLAAVDQYTSPEALAAIPQQEAIKRQLMVSRLQGEFQKPVGHARISVTNNLYAAAELSRPQAPERLVLNEHGQVIDDKGPTPTTPRERWEQAEARNPQTQQPPIIIEGSFTKPGARERWQNNSGPVTRIENTTTRLPNPDATRPSDRWKPAPVQEQRPAEAAPASTPISARERWNSHSTANAPKPSTEAPSSGASTGNVPSGAAPAAA